jgi:hypothetical protein
MNQEQVISDNKYLNLWKDLLRMEYSKGRYDTITKVVEWLEEHLLDYWGQQNSDPSNFLIEFKKAMEQ